MKAIACPACRKAMIEGDAADGSLLLVCPLCLCGYAVEPGRRSNAANSVYEAERRFHAAQDRIPAAQQIGGPSRDYARSARGSSQLGRTR